ncbi:hypothetical protein MUU72_16315 [Streptomyces sp. RS10V-4]|uniref:hypothetical protein n=1 Tax=Streptomyces rhizoryzae TaxID=2932493 RepID=UPI00200340EB|nr:hypothetical protein [Streptomyces rhizoryzae]MCK7624645.1 hypothetical protein [Streptomyces rhizoryzae]
MTPEDAALPTEQPAPPSLEPPPDGEPLRTEAEPDVSELIDAIGGAARAGGPFVYAPHGNINAGSVHGGQRVHNVPADEGRRRREGRVREGPVPEAEVRAAAYGFARPDWFEAALEKLQDGPLFLAGRDPVVAPQR